MGRKLNFFTKILLTLFFSVFFVLFTYSVFNFTYKAEEDVTITFERDGVSDITNIIDVKSFDVNDKELKSEGFSIIGNKLKLDSTKKYLISPKEGYTIFGYTYKVGENNIQKATYNKKAQLSEHTVKEDGENKEYRLIRFTNGNYNAVFSDKIYVDILDGKEIVTSIYKNDSLLPEEEFKKLKTLNSVTKELLTSPSIYGIANQTEINMVLNKGVKIIYTDNYLETEIELRKQNIIKNIYNDSEWSIVAGKKYSFEDIEIQIGNIENEEILNLKSSPYFIFKKLFKNEYADNISDNKLGKTKITLRKNLILNPEDQSIKRDFISLKDFGEVEFSEIVNLKIGNYYLLKSKSNTIDNRTIVKMPKFNISTVLDEENKDQDKVTVGDLFVIENSSLYLGSSLNEKSKMLLDRISTKGSQIDGNGFIKIDHKSGIIIDNVEIEVTSLAKSSVTISKPLIYQRKTINKEDLIKIKHNNENLVKIDIKNFKIYYTKTEEDINNQNYREVEFLLLKTECANIINLNLENQDDTIILDVNASEFNLKNLNKAKSVKIEINNLSDDPKINIDNVKFNNNNVQSTLLDLTNKHNTSIVDVNILGETTFTASNFYAIQLRSNLRLNFYENYFKNIITYEENSSLRIYGLKNQDTEQYAQISKERKIYIQPHLIGYKSVYWSNDNKKVYSGDLLTLLNKSNIDNIVGDSSLDFKPHYEKEKTIELDVNDKDKLKIPFWSKIDEKTLLQYGESWKTSNNILFDDTYYIGPLNDEDFEPYKVDNVNSKAIFDYVISDNKIKNFNIAIYKKDYGTNNYIKMRNIIISSKSFDSNKYVTVKRKIKIKQEGEIIFNVGKKIELKLSDKYFKIFNGDKTEIAYSEILSPDSIGSEEQEIDKIKFFNKYPSIKDIFIQTDKPEFYLEVGTEKLNLNLFNIQNLNLIFEFDKGSGVIEIVENNKTLNKEDYIFIPYNSALSNESLESILLMYFKTKIEDGKKVLELEDGRPVPLEMEDGIVSYNEINGNEYKGDVYLAYLLYEEGGEWKLHNLTKIYKVDNNEEVIASKYFFKAGNYTFVPQSNEGYRFIGEKELNLEIKKKGFRFNFKLPEYKYQNSREYKDATYLIKLLSSNDENVELEVNESLLNPDDIVNIIKKPREKYKLDKQNIELKVGILTLFENKDAGDNKTAEKISVFLIGDNASNFEMTLEYNDKVFDPANSVTIERVKNIKINKLKVSIKVLYENNPKNKLLIDFVLQASDAIRKGKDNLPYKYKENDEKYNVLDTLHKLNDIFTAINKTNYYDIEGAYGDFKVEKLEFAFKNELEYLNTVDINKKETYNESNMNHVISSKTYEKVIYIKNKEELINNNANYEIDFDSSEIDLIVKKAKLNIKLYDITPYYLDNGQPVPKYKENDHGLNYNDLFDAIITDKNGESVENYIPGEIYTVELKNKDTNNDYESKNKKLTFRVVQAIVGYRFKKQNSAKINKYLLVNENDLNIEKLNKIIRERVVFIDQFGDEIKVDTNENLQKLKNSLQIDETFKIPVKKPFNYLNASFNLPIKFNLSVLGDKENKNFDFKSNTELKLDTKTNSYINYINVTLNILLNKFESPDPDKSLVIDQKLEDPSSTSSNLSYNIISKETAKDNYENLMENLQKSIKKDMSAKVSSSKAYKSNKFRPTALVNISFNSKIFSNNPTKMYIKLGKKSINNKSTVLYLDTSAYGTPVYRKLTAGKDYDIKDGVLQIKSVDNLNGSLNGQYIIGNEKSSAGLIVGLTFLILIVISAVTVLILKKNKKIKK